MWLLLYLRFLRFGRLRISLVKAFLSQAAPHGLRHKLLRRVDHADAALSLRQLRVQIELHELVETFVAIPLELVTQGASCVGRDASLVLGRLLCIESLWLHIYLLMSRVARVQLYRLHLIDF